MRRALVLWLAAVSSAFASSTFRLVLIEGPGAEGLHAAASALRIRHYAEADAHMEAARAAAMRGGARHPNFRLIANEVARHYTIAGLELKALAVYDNALEIARREKASAVEFGLLTDKASFLALHGYEMKAHALYTSLIEDISKGELHPVLTIWLLTNAAANAEVTGNDEIAENWFTRAVNIASWNQKRDGPSWDDIGPHNIQTRCVLAAFYDRHGRYAEAEARYREALANATTDAGKIEVLVTFVARLRLLKQNSEAEQVLKEIVRLREAADPLGETAAQSRRELAEFYKEIGKTDMPERSPETAGQQESTQAEEAEQDEPPAGEPEPEAASVEENLARLSGHCVSVREEGVLQKLFDAANHAPDFKASNDILRRIAGTVACPPAGGDDMFQRVVPHLFGHFLLTDVQTLLDRWSAVVTETQGAESAAMDGVLATRSVLAAYQQNPVEVERCEEERLALSERNHGPNSETALSNKWALARTKARRGDRNGAEKLWIEVLSGVTHLPESAALRAEISRGFDPSRVWDVY